SILLPYTTLFRSRGDRRDRRAHAGGRDVRRLPLRPHRRVAQEQLSPLGAFAPALERAAVDERPAVEIVVDVARQDEAVHERRVEEQLLEALQRPEPDQIAAAD